MTVSNIATNNYAAMSKNRLPSLKKALLEYFVVRTYREWQSYWTRM